MACFGEIQWRNGQAIDISEQNNIVYLSGNGWTPQEIGRALGSNQKTVKKYLNRLFTTGRLDIKKRSGRPRATTPEEDLFINLKAIETPTIALAQMKNELNLGILEKKQSGRQSVPAFGILSRREVGPLIRIEGRFNGERYRDLLDEYVLPYIEDNFGDHFYYYQDNSPIHTCREVRWWLEQNVPEFQMIKPPPKSFDINPIENCWAVAKVNLAKNGIFDDQDNLWMPGLSCSQTFSSLSI